MPPTGGGPVLENLSRPPLRIAIVAPPWFPVPPGGYGGIESMVHTLVEGLATRGHEIVLVGAGKPHRSAKFLQTYVDPRPDRRRNGHLLPRALALHRPGGHLRRAARQGTRPGLGGPRLQRHPGGRVPVPGEEGGLLPVPRADQPREIP